MKKKSYKKTYKKIYKKMDLLEDLKMSFLNFSFVMVYIIYKMLALRKNGLNFFKGDILECFFKGATKLNFMLYSHVVIILFRTGLYKSSFSPYSLCKTRFSCFCVLAFHTLFSLY